MPTPTTQPFWDALAEERDRAAALRRLRRVGLLPAVAAAATACPTAWSGRRCRARRSIFTFSVARQPTFPAFADEVPQIIAVVELAEGVHMTTTIVGAEPDAVRVGAAVEPVFDHGADGLTLLRHRLA